MHKSERLLFLCLFVLGLLVIGCHKSTANALRVVRINDGKAVEVDVLDDWTYTDPDPEVGVVEVTTTSDVIVPVEVAYTEQGTGLPTYPGPYTARINKYTVTFKDVTTGTETDYGEPVRGSCNFLIPADPDMKNTVIQDIKIVPFEWIETNMGDLEDGMVLKATIKLDGWDEISGKAVADSGYVTIDAADYVDDPNKKGS